MIKCAENCNIKHLLCSLIAISSGYNSHIIITIIIIINKNNNKVNENNHNKKLDHSQKPLQTKKWITVHH